MTSTAIIYNLAATHCIYFLATNLLCLSLSAGKCLWPHTIKNYGSKVGLTSGNMLKVKFSEEFFSVQVAI